MNSGMRPGFSRLLAVGLLLAVVGLGYVLGVAPLIDRYRAIADDTAATADLLAQYQRLGAQKEILAEHLATVRKNPALTAGFLAGSNETLVSAQLQSELKRIVEGSGGTLTTVQVLPVKEVDGFHLLTIRAQMAGTVDAVQKVIFDLEAGRPLLFLDNVNIRPKRVRRRDRNSEPDTSLLDARFEVAGYLGGRTP